MLAIKTAQRGRNSNESTSNLRPKIVIQYYIVFHIPIENQVTFSFEIAPQIGQLQQQQKPEATLNRVSISGQIFVPDGLL